MGKNPHTDYAYHVSPHAHIGKLRPTGGHKGTQSISMSQGGVYVAPKFRDALAWYASFVRHKKNESNACRRHRSENGPHRGFSEPAHYNGATIYKLAVPKGFLKRLWSADWWEPEYFIPGEMMGEVSIVSAKTYTDTELLGLYDRSRNKEWESQRGRWDIEKIARELRRNVAARKYIAFLEEFREMAMRRDERLQSSDYQMAFQNLMHYLRRFFVVEKFHEPYVPKPRCDDVPGMEYVCARIRKLLDTPKEKFRYWQWKRLRPISDKAKYWWRNV